MADRPSPYRISYPPRTTRALACGFVKMGLGKARSSGHWILEAPPNSCQRGPCVKSQNGLTPCADMGDPRTTSHAALHFAMPRQPALAASSSIYPGTVGGRRGDLTDPRSWPARDSASSRSARVPSLRGWRGGGRRSKTPDIGRKSIEPHLPAHARAAPPRMPGRGEGHPSQPTERMTHFVFLSRAGTSVPSHPPTLLGLTMHAGALAMQCTIWVHGRKGLRPRRRGPAMSGRTQLPAMILDFADAAAV